MYRYLTRIYTTLHSRGDIEILALEIKRGTRIDGHIQGKVQFYNDSTLTFEEKAVKRGIHIEKIFYRYHYQHANGTLIFRYDNAPHHPEIAPYPHHIHIPGRVAASKTPNLSTVLRRIDRLLYPTGRQNNTP